MSSVNPSPLELLSSMGQSVWIDFLSRSSTRGDHLQKLINDDAVVGATSNPSIFEKAMGSGDAYDEQLGELDHTLDIKDVFWALAEQDIRDACEVFRPVFEQGGGRDGYVSLEVDPGLAYDTLATFRAAMGLHEDLELPNLMVKIPATKPGLAAIEDVIAEGRSINVTLIFSLQRYAEVAESYLRGIERLIAAGGDPRKVASVAIRRAALGVPGVQGRHPAAGAVGVDVGQEPRLPRHPVYRGADRLRHGQHHARGDDQRLPGPRQPAGPPGERSGGGAGGL
jgi:transaldolase